MSKKFLITTGTGTFTLEAGADSNMDRLRNTRIADPNKFYARIRIIPFLSCSEGSAHKARKEALQPFYPLLHGQKGGLAAGAAPPLQPRGL